MDRFDDMRARGGAGGAGGGVNVDGTETTGIAQTGISAGKRFVGTPSGELPILSTENILSKKILCVSDDLSVYVPEPPTFNKTSTSFPICIKNESGQYETVIMPLPTNLSDILTKLNIDSVTANTVVINEDGTLIALNGYYNGFKFIMVTEVNKESKTGITYAIENPVDGFSLYALYGLRENFIFVKASGYYNVIYKYNNGTLTKIFSDEKSSNYNTDIWSRNGVKIIGNYIYCAVQHSSTITIYKLTKNGVQLASINHSGYGVSISDNGLVGLHDSNRSPFVYDMDLGNLNLTKISNIDGEYVINKTNVYPDSNGYVITSKGIYNITTGNKVSSTPNSTTLIDKFESKNGFFVYESPNTNCYKIAFPELGEYAITKCDSTNIVMQSGKVYGVAVEDIKAGEAGKIKLLFRTSAEETT